MEFTHKEGDKYLVTGVYHNSTKRFRQMHSNPRQALGINLWHGRVWQIRDGKRTLLKRVNN